MDSGQQRIGAHHDPGFGVLLRGGMVRKKNILSTLNLSFIMIGLIGVQWVLYGYSLAFGDDVGGGLVGQSEILRIHGGDR